MNLKIKLFSTVAIALYLFTGCNSATTTAEPQTDTAASQAMPMTTDSTTKMDNMQMDNAMMGTMNAMMSKMSGMQMTGDFDMDFATMMIAHHQGAIDMSKMEVSKGKDEKMKSMAQNIITKQTEEIGKLQAIIKNLKSSNMKLGSGELEKSMSAMKATMSGMQMTGDADKDFATMMIAHHEAAIAMSKKEIEYGMNSRLNQMAQKGITEETREINEFKAWLNTKK